MKKLIFPAILAILIALEIIYMNEIKNVATDIINSNPDLIIAPSNEYYKDYDFKYVQRSNDYVPYSIKDIRNIFYSVINNGWEEFTFYCPSEYEDCVKDVQTISGNDTLLTNINNYAHPFNAFASIETTYDDSGEVNIKLNKLYNKDEITKIKTEVNRVIKSLINDSMTDREKIKTIHDYIINNTEYDKVRNETGNSAYDSNTAYGTLFDHFAICSGYADTMELFLTEFGIKNYKIASTTHVWNAVYIDNTWYHLDLTWDDPVSDRGPILDYSYFLINNNQLKEADGEEITTHNFDKTIYLEFNY